MSKFVSPAAVTTVTSRLTPQAFEPSPPVPEVIKRDAESQNAEKRCILDWGVGKRGRYRIGGQLAERFKHTRLLSIDCSNELVFACCGTSRMKLSPALTFDQ